MRVQEEPIMALSRSNLAKFIAHLADDPKQVDSIQDQMLKGNPELAHVAHLCRLVNALRESNRKLALDLAVERAKRPTPFKG